MTADKEPSHKEEGAVREPKITFIGPLARPARGKGASFLLVQGAGAAVRLEYPTINSAASARKLLLTGALAHSITTENLLSAIQNALAQAANQAEHGVSIE